MGEARIPVDLFNPGQVMACLGLVEVALALHGDAEGGFDWSSSERTRFVLRVPGDDDPVESARHFLVEAEIAAVAPAGSANHPAASDKLAKRWRRWGIDVEALPDNAPFPFPDPTSPATLPAVLRHESVEVPFTYWGDETRRDNLKFWGGAGGYPGAGLLRDALDLLRAELESHRGDLFDLSARQSSSFRLDWRRDYTALDAGFSLNKHTHVEARGHPLVEILAAIGLTHARPRREHKLLYHYGVLGTDGRDPGGALRLWPAPMLRAALGGTLDTPLPTRHFTMQLDWPGQKGQARCITTVSEETSP